MMRFCRLGRLILVIIPLLLVSCKNEGYTGNGKDLLPSELDLDYEQAGRFHQYMKALKAQRIHVRFYEQAYDKATLSYTLSHCQAAKDKSPEQITQMLSQVSGVIRSSLASPPDCLDISFNLSKPGENLGNTWNFPCPETE